MVSYTGSIVKWTVDELAFADRKTCKLFTIHKGVHPRVDVDRLYLPTNFGGHSLKSVIDSLVRQLSVALGENWSIHM